MWIGTYGQGVVRIDANGTPSPAFHPRHRLATEYVHSIGITRQENGIETLWVGTSTSGLVRIRIDHPWLTLAYGDSEIDSSPVFAMLEDTSTHERNGGLNHRALTELVGDRVLVHTRSAANPLPRIQPA
jgi:ligand-binding sensor domain-containing protein